MRETTPKARWAAIVALSAAALLGGCQDDSVPFQVVRPPPDAGCQLGEGPQRYEVYFVIDVSGSMAPFLNNLAAQVQSFSRSFPERDARDNRIMVDYYVVAFVNDVLWVPNNARRMTQPIAVQAAIEEAVMRGADNTLLTSDTKNAEPEENLLDALAEVIGSNPRDDAGVIVIVATDAGFKEAPDRLSGNIQVHSTYSSIRSDLEGLGVQLHAFTPDGLDGLTRTYRNLPPLTSIPNSGSYSLRDLEASGDLIEQTLRDIALNATCN